MDLEKRKKLINSYITASGVKKEDYSNQLGLKFPSTLSRWISGVMASKKIDDFFIEKFGEEYSKKLYKIKVS